MAISVNTVEELRERPLYRESLSFSDGVRQLLDILGEYSFPEAKMIPCGIQGCRTPHMRGFLVVTTDGLETNIGNVCGKKHLGVNFQEKRTAFRQKQVEIRNVSQIFEVKQLLKKLKPTLERLEVRSGRIAKLKILVNKAHPQLVRLVSGRAKLSQASLFKTVLMEESEARRQYTHEVEPDSKGRLESFENWFIRRRPVKSIAAGSLIGLSFWKHDLHKLLRQDILNTVNELEGLADAAILELTPLILRRYAKWGQTLEQRINEVYLIVQEGEDFFSCDNIEALKLLEPELDLASRRNVRDALDQLRKAASL
ncbi:hypothetical protein [Pseudomonas lundensis]|uniref:hypothetical protein n=1 Tax=Pseudomonas lundensis TaxID=86185 RepID=UPI000BA1DDCA|nr:hypothetical protein [Pseudomonas lundensis]NMZ98069.1 hypothetical protein [Pseudomonas lundensis]OZY50672.1 hypothetical protein CJF34_10490 [Pseudomonas lundensis]